MGDEGVRDRASAPKHLQERFQTVKTPTVGTLVAKLAQLLLEGSE